ncbi:hypothetical protein, partial [Chishuiella sp.]|uniref:hypothetical protein n=1 Tax=Chishuiella sp. TaxID=1969467 RepID=UPI0028B139DD
EQIKELILTNRKQIYKKYTTNNVMAYVQEYKMPQNMATYQDPRVSLWYWQWKIINAQLW